MSEGDQRQGKKRESRKKRDAGRGKGTTAKAPGKTAKPPLVLGAAMRSFLGHLEGAGKSRHTIANYETDLRVFQDFLNRISNRVPSLAPAAAGTLSLQTLTLEDLERYHGYLQAQGLKTNTRRRKILTVRKLLRYLNQRRKLEFDVANRIPAPGKIERVPVTFSQAELLAKIRELPCASPMELRNQVLLMTLAETGCLVSEVARIRFEDWKFGPEGATVRVGGTKEFRELPVSTELARQVRKLQANFAGSTDSGKVSRTQGNESCPWLFVGFNRAGPLDSPISPRGVELLIRAYSSVLVEDPAAGPRIVPKHFRQSAVLAWYRAGIPRGAIRERLGLRTDYAFRVFEPLFRSVSRESGSETPESHASGSGAPR
jgi:site-specific recombinase XerD